MPEVVSHIGDIRWFCEGPIDCRCREAKVVEFRVEGSFMFDLHRGRSVCV